MKKLISMLLITMILCSLFTVPALAEDAQGPTEGSTNGEALTATMSVTGGTINPDGTVTWALGENILTITMSDGSVYTVTVIYDPEAEITAPASLSTLTVSGTEIPMTGNVAAAVTPNAADTLAIVTEPADAAVTVSVNGNAVENIEDAINWAEGRNEVTIEVAKEGYETSAYTLTVDYTPAQEEATTPEETTTSEESVTPEQSAAPEESATPEQSVAPEEPATPEEAAIPEQPAAAEEPEALAGLIVDGKEIDLDKFEKGSSDETQSSYSFNAAQDAEYDLKAASGTVVVTAAEGWTVSSVKLNGTNLTASAADSYNAQWARANDLEITLKKNGSEIKAVYDLILSCALNETAADALTVNGADVSFLTSVPAAANNSYILQVIAGEGKTAAVWVNGVPAALDPNGTLVVPAVTGAAGTADTVAVTVSKAGCFDKTYVFTVTAVVAPTEPVAESATDTAFTGTETPADGTTPAAE